MPSKKQDFISLSDFNQNQLWRVLVLSKELKRQRFSHILQGRTVALIFQKPSTRTTVSFAVGVAQLGGHPLILNADSLQLKRGESPKDTGRVLSRYLDSIVIRANKHSDVLEMAKYASIPIINGLTDLEHPCQVLADLLTIMEHRRLSHPRQLKGLKVAYLGDGNNVAQSWMLAAAILGIKFHLACPPSYRPLRKMVQLAQRLSKKGKGHVSIVTDLKKAIKGADVVYTDVWASMGQEAEREKRLRVFSPYQVNKKVLSLAKKNTLVMHCLPAHRGEEITNDVFEGKNSVVFDQAENRLHVQKAILATLMTKGKRS